MNLQACLYIPKQHFSFIISLLSTKIRSYYTQYFAIYFFLLPYLYVEVLFLTYATIYLVLFTGYKIF